MSGVFAVRPQVPLEQVWLEALLTALKPAAEGGTRTFSRVEVRRLMAGELALVPQSVHEQSLDAAISSMADQKFWVPQENGSYVLTAEGSEKLGLSIRDGITG